MPVCVFVPERKELGVRQDLFFSRMTGAFGDRMKTGFRELMVVYFPVAVGTCLHANILKYNVLL